MATIWSTTTDDGRLLTCVVLPDAHGYVVRLLIDDEPHFGRVCATDVEAARIAQAWWEDSTRGRL